MNYKFTRKDYYEYPLKCNSFRKIRIFAFNSLKFQVKREARVDVPFPKLQSIDADNAKSH